MKQTLNLFVDLKGVGRNRLLLGVLLLLILITGARLGYFHSNNTKSLVQGISIDVAPSPIVTPIAEPTSTPIPTPTNTPIPTNSPSDGDGPGKDCCGSPKCNSSESLTGSI